MKAVLVLGGAATLLAAAPAFAQASADEAPQSLATEYRLSEAEKDKLLADAVAKREAEEELLPPPKRQVHGEVGVAVGTGGFHSVYGTSAVPLGDSGMAVISFENTDFGNNYGRRYRRR